jgi:hypothetical protein
MGLQDRGGVSGVGVAKWTLTQIQHIRQDQQQVFLLSPPFQLRLLPLIVIFTYSN